MGAVEKQQGEVASAGLAVPDLGAPLRIGLIVDDFPVVSETFVINMAVGLLQRGHDVRVLAMGGRSAPTAPVHRTVRRYDLDRRVRRSAAARLLIDNAERGREGAAPHRWGLRRRAAAFVSQAAMLAFQPGFDVVHCQFANLGLAARRHRMLGTLRTRRLVVHVRGHDVTSFTATHGEHIYIDLFRSADLVIANCRHFLRRAVALGADPARSCVIGSAIDCDRFRPTPHSVDTSQLKLIAVGRLVEKKGFGDAIRAVAEFARSHPQVSFEIVGDGPLRPHLAALIRDLGQGARIRLSGALAQEEVASRLAAADIFLAPSVTAASGDQDANVNTLKEAMATALPVIATRHGGIPELVEDGVTGYLVPESDPAALASALRHLVAERSSWSVMGRRGRQRVKAEFDLPVVTDRLTGAYRALLHQKEPVP